MEASADPSSGRPDGGPGRRLSTRASGPAADDGRASARSAGGAADARAVAPPAESRAGADGPRDGRDGSAAAYGGRMPRRHVAVAAGLGLGLGALALGPALAPGFTLAYDMVFVPYPVFTRATFGLTGMPPRQVPSDAVVTALSHVAPADVVQKTILLGIFVLACVSAARLVPSRRLTPRLVAGVVYAWNPFVAERLLLGQWALLLGYAALPAVAAAAARGGPGRLACALVPAAVGGFAALAVSVPVALPMAACRRDGRRGVRTAWTAAIVLAAGLPWLVPGLLRAAAIPGDAAGVSAFAARADTPFGALGSLLLLGGAWNAETVPSGYGSPATVVPWLCVVALALAAYASGGRRIPGLGVAAGTGFALAALGVVAGGSLGAAVRACPFLAVLRDGQQYVAPLAVVVAVGAGLAADRLASAAAGPGWTAGRFASAGQRLGWAAVRSARPGAGPAQAGGGPGGAEDKPALAEHGVGRPETGRDLVEGGRNPASQGAGEGGCGRADDGQGTMAGGRRRVTGGRGSVEDGRGGAVYAVPALLVPLALLPGLAWGAAGRLGAVRYPADWARARAVVAADPGDVLVLPWEAYRSYPWNGGRRVLDPLPRFLPVRVILNDSVRVATRGGGTIRMTAEDPRARALDPLARSGAPLTGALRARGVRYVAIDVPESPEAAGWEARLAGVERVVSGPDLILYRVPRTGRLAGR